MRNLRVTWLPNIWPIQVPDRFFLAEEEARGGTATPLAGVFATGLLLPMVPLHAVTSNTSHTYSLLPDQQGPKAIEFLRHGSLASFTIESCATRVTTKAFLWPTRERLPTLLAMPGRTRTFGLSDDFSMLLDHHHSGPVALALSELLRLKRCARSYKTALSISGHASQVGWSIQNAPMAPHF
jgi:hypothetical protein